MSVQSPNTTVSDKVTPQKSLPLAAPYIRPFDEKDSYVGVNHEYQLVQWRHLPNNVKHRFYEEAVFRQQPASQYNSITRTRKHGINETSLQSKYASNHLSGIFAPDNLERLKGKQ